MRGESQKLLRRVNFILKSAPYKFYYIYIFVIRQNLWLSDLGSEEETRKPSSTFKAETKK